MTATDNELDRKNKKQEAYEALKELIIMNKLPADTTLIERQISDMLGISRTPIRAALQELKNDGFVVSYPGKGMMVARLAIDDVVEIYELRKSLDPLSLTLFMNRDLKEIKSKMRSLIAEMERSYAEDDLAAFTRADNAFHECYIYNTGNRRLDRINGMIADQVRRMLNLTATDKEQCRIALEAHKAIMAAIDMDDAEVAASLIKEHISQSLERHIRKVTRR